MAALQGLSDRIVLETSTFTLGRAPGNQIVLNDGKVSSHHAVLQLLGEEYSITDLGSSNGTYINESRLQANTPTELKDGDKIRLGDTTYTYEGNRQDASGHEPTVIASKPSQSYQATMLASPPQPGSFEQNPSSNPGYNQSTPSPAYPQQNPSSNPGYNQGTPSPAYPQQNPQSNPGYNQGTPSSPSYPQYAPTVASSVPPTPVQQPAYPPQQAEQPYQQQAESYGQPGYPQQTPGQPYQQPGQAYPQPGQYQQPEQAPGQPYQQPGQAYPQPGQYQQPGQPGLPYQQPWGEVPQAFSQPTPPKRSGVKVLIIILVILLVLGAGGGGAAYFLTRPQPTINVTSNYTAGSTPAGASGTELNVSGQKFSGNSEITFLLDGNPVSGLATGHSDSNGALTTTLKVTDAWQVGNHTLTAKDASGYKTAAGKAITVVTPGQSHTPGPNGAPSDDASGTVVASITTSDGADTVTLNITGKADGGTVCRDLDDGQPHQSTGTSSGLTYVETVIATCEGTYKGGKLTYTETVSSDKVELEGGYVCQATKPYILRHLEGTFTDKATVKGTFSSDAVTITCNKGLGSNNTAAGTGTWTGVASMQ